MTLIGAILLKVLISIIISLEKDDIQYLYFSMSPVMWELLSRQNDGTLVVIFHAAVISNQDSDYYRSRNVAKESETNVIDRAIANIMFNKMDFNLQDSTSIGSDSFEHDIVGACDPYATKGSNDFAVPVFGKK